MYFSSFIYAKLLEGERGSSRSRRVWSGGDKGAATDLSSRMGAEVGYSRRNVFLAAGSVFTLFVGVGIIMGWASPSIPRLKKENYNFTKSQENLLSSITGLAPGPLITIFGIDTIGRKGTLFVIWLTTVVGPIMMLISRDIYNLLVARFISGLGMAAAFSAIGIYISEISDVGVRNALNSTNLLFATLGNLVAYCFGPFISFFNFTIVTLAFSSVFGILWYFLPESPYYYVGKGKIEQARSSLTYIKRGATPEFIDKALTDIVYSIEEEKRNKTGFKKLITSKVVLKQFAISFYLLYLQQGSGLGPLGAFMQTIFDQAQLGFSGAYVPIFLAIATTILTLSAPLLLKKFGSKSLFMFGGFGGGSCMVALGIYFILLNNGYDLSAIRYLSILLALGAMMCCYCGLGGSVWGMISDLFAPSVKGAATGICGIFSTFLGFVATEIFGELKDHVGFGVTFLCFGVVQLIASIGLIFVDDTSKMTLQEIQDHFEGNNKRQEKENDFLS